MSILTISSYKENLENLRENLKRMLPTESLEIFDKDANYLESSLTTILKVKEGDTAPDFTLSNATNESVNLYNILLKKNVIIVFYRGTWCPYCNLTLSLYQSIMPILDQHNTRLIAISAQTPDESLTFKEKNELEFEVLSDNENLVSRLYTTVFKNGDAPLSEMEKLGFDFHSYYGDDTNEIPVPAVFIINQNRKITFAKTEGGDYRKRTEPAEIINNVKSLQS